MMRLSLANKISVTIFGVLALALVSSVVAIGSAFRFEAFQTTLVADNLASVRAAEELEIALLGQRGHVASYILDEGNGEWLECLDRDRKEFDDWLNTARATARSDKEREILDHLEEVQQAYAQVRDEVVVLYDSGHEKEAKQLLLTDVTVLYQRAYDLCEKFIVANQELVDKVAARVRRQVEQITLIATITLVVTIGLGVALLWLFFQGVLSPLRRISADARVATGNDPTKEGDQSDDELRELGHYVQLLMTNVSETRSDLEFSRSQLARADKLAAVGKLAASVAHEIRNPLTAVKMWIFSLRRAVGEDGEVQQNIDVISDEIARLENVVRHFLDFARPPQLNSCPLAVGLLLDNSIELVKHQLHDQRITLIREDDPALPQVVVDADQLKQVFLNLINNAIDAMPDGGEIRFACSQRLHGGRAMVAVQISDSGTGMRDEVQHRIFEPFFTTKEDGTGLGLCIAASIMARHSGLLQLEKSDTKGTQWCVWIPAVD